MRPNFLSLIFLHFWINLKSLKLIYKYLVSKRHKRPPSTVHKTFHIILYMDHKSRGPDEDRQRGDGHGIRFIPVDRYSCKVRNFHGQCYLN